MGLAEFGHVYRIQLTGFQEPVSARAGSKRTIGLYAVLGTQPSAPCGPNGTVGLTLCCAEQSSAHRFRPGVAFVLNIGDKLSRPEHSDLW